MSKKFLIITAFFFLTSKSFSKELDFLMLQALVKKNPYNYPANLNLAISLIKIGKTREAEEKLLFLTKNFPYNWEAFYNLSLLYAKRGELEKALKLIAKYKGPPNKKLSFLQKKIKTALLDKLKEYPPKWLINSSPKQAIKLCIDYDNQLELFFLLKKFHPSLIEKVENQILNIAAIAIKLSTTNFEKAFKVFKINNSSNELLITENFKIKIPESTTEITFPLIKWPTFLFYVNSKLIDSLNKSIPKLNKALQLYEEKFLRTPVSIEELCKNLKISFEKPLDGEFFIEDGKISYSIIPLSISHFKSANFIELGNFFKSKNTLKAASLFFAYSVNPIDILKMCFISTSLLLNNFDQDLNIKPEDMLVLLISLDNTSLKIGWRFELEILKSILKNYNTLSNIIDKHNN